MSIEIKVPALGESVTEATVAAWKKKVGDAVAKDEALCELETDKVTLEVNAPEAGVLSEIKAPEGTNVEIGQVLGTITAAGAAAAAPKTSLSGVSPTNQTSDAGTASRSSAARKIAGSGFRAPTSALETTNWTARR